MNEQAPVTQNQEQSEITDEAARAVQGVRLALELGLAPVVDQASPLLHSLLEVAGEKPEPLPGFSAGNYILSVVTSKLHDLRAKALWPHPKGTKVLVIHNDVPFESKTTTASRAAPDGTVLINVEGITGAVQPEQIRKL